MGGRLDLWVVPECTTVFPDSPIEPENEVFSAGEGHIRLAGAVNEVVAFQVAFRSDRAEAITGLSLEDLRAGDRVVAGDQAAFFREVRLAVDDYPAWFLRLTPFLKETRLYPDVLVPLEAPRGALPIELEPGEAEAVWCEIRIPFPAGQPPLAGSA